jgi:nucleotide-binding universal stress UspA family protein
VPVVAVAFDGSPEAQLALETAWRIAAGTGATVRICRAVEPLAYAPGFAPHGETTALDAERVSVAEAEADDVVAGAPQDVTVEHKVASGPARDTLLALAGTDCDLLVTGSRHYGPLHRVLAGGVSAGLLAAGRLPVLVTARTAAVRTPSVAG